MLNNIERLRTLRSAMPVLRIKISACMSNGFAIVIATISGWFGPDAADRVINYMIVADIATIMRNMTRSLPSWLAPVVEQLELDQPAVVSTADIRVMLDELGIAASARDVARRLRERGWLLLTGVRGVYEFAPGANAGPFGTGDPFRLVTAVLAGRPASGVAVALGSAVWAHGMTDRAPDKVEVAFPSDERVPASIRSLARVVTFDGRAAYEVRKGVPVHSLAAVLVHMASKPRVVRSWGAVVDWLPDVASAVDLAAIEEELVDRPESVRRRVGYLLQGVRPDIAVHLRGSSTAKIWFGSRGPLIRNSEPWAVADTVLPFDPAQLVHE